ncbi:reverse transcriptase domain-containing protein [Tanacetum coccineum]
MYSLGWDLRKGKGRNRGDDPYHKHLHGPRVCSPVLEPKGKNKEGETRESSYEVALPVQANANEKIKESTEGVSGRTQEMNLWRVKIVQVEDTERDNPEELKRKQQTTCLGPMMRSSPLLLLKESTSSFSQKEFECLPPSKRSTRLWFDELPPESIDSFKELRKKFLAHYLQQKRYTRYPVELHHVKQKEGESTEAFLKRFTSESPMFKEAP